MNFRVDLDIFRGPMDLLLYLVKKDELDIVDIPLASITDQFVGYLDVIQEMSIGSAGEFLEMASYLLEMKSKLVLPSTEETDDQVEDPREGLVQRLLEYKKYKDAASMLEDRRRDWQQRYQRVTNDLPPRKLDPSDQPIREVEMWDLVSAIGRIMRDNRPPPEPNIVYDDTPITTYMRRIQEQLRSSGKVTFTSLFHEGMHKSALIGVFLAILELVRHNGVEAKQDELHGEIWIYPGKKFNDHIDLSKIDTYEHGKENDELPAGSEVSSESNGPENGSEDGGEPEVQSKAS